MPTALLAVLAAIAAAWLIRNLILSPRKLDVPYLKFEGDNSQARYIKESRTLMDKGYDEYLKKGLPFSMRNPVDPKRPILMLPMKYLEEVRSAPETKWSFPLFLERSTIIKEVGGPTMSREATQIARLDLNRALTNLIEPMQEECLAAYKVVMLPCPDWTPIQPYQFLLQMFTRITARVLVGPELCGSKDWLDVTLGYTNCVLKAIPKVRASYHPSVRWLAKYIDKDARLVVKQRRRAAEVLRPVFEARINDSKSPAEAGDAVQWLIDGYRAQGRKPTPQKLADDELSISVASIHSSSATALSTLFDLMDHQDSLAEIREEISQVRKEYPTWTRNALGSLKLLDSFMKESQRVHSLTQLTMQRWAVSPVTFKDGFHIPAGIPISFANHQLNLDPAVHSDPEVFDAKRFSRKRKGADATKFHFASVSDDSINWGSGMHACPGRFLAQETLKLMFVHLLTHYEFKHPEEGQGRPLDAHHNFTFMPNVGASVLFREKDF
ncbi:cytochrome P450 [Xylariaceae sp. FL0662B]|nr:cytochrome P450 [Xylariaceae sp. FL0662B]